MEFKLDPDNLRFIDEEVRSGRYATANEVVSAALARLRQPEAGSFEPGELDALISEGIQDIENGRLIDGESVFADLKKAAHLRSHATE